MCVDDIDAPRPHKLPEAVKPSDTTAVQAVNGATEIRELSEQCVSSTVQIHNPDVEARSICMTDGVEQQLFRSASRKIVDDVENARLGPDRGTVTHHGNS
jgi:hypothetical protein